MDLLVRGRIHTLDAARPLAGAVLVRDGRVARVGDAPACAAEARPGARTIDLGAGSAVPGLCDAHAHPLLFGRSLVEVSCAGAASAEACAARVAERARRTAPGEWIRGRGWDQNRWPGAAYPDAGALDRAAPRHPVLLERIDGHAAWVNGAALRAAGISRDTADPPGGRILRDAAGAPTGVLVDAAQDLVLRAVPRPSADALDRDLLRGLEALAAAGLTEVHDAGAPPDLLAAYRRLAAAGRLPLRVYAMLDGQVAPDELDARIAARGPAEQGLLTVRAVKLFADGALGSRGAALLAPYDDDPSTTGLVLLDAGALLDRLRRIARAGLQPAVHAIGDRACRDVVAALEALAAEVPLAPLRPRIEHLQILAPGDLARVARVGAVASMQPVHATSDGPWAERRLGARVEGAYALRSVLDAGIPLALGSDCPVEGPDPRAGLLAAEARTPAGWDAPWTPAQRISRGEALAGFTRGAAWAAFAEGRRGALREGMDADLTLFGADLLDVPAAALAAVPVVGTIVAGEAKLAVDSR